ncbi:hypothetical protein [Kitasatospora sp. NPDC086791]|uniref:hypothetical protein n=1 Tax=Kitasatospora sp. NPDC086791 TaxID=3155178 RepID=UPI003449E536
MEFRTAILIEAAALVDKIDLPVHEPFALTPRADGVVVRYRDSLTPEQRATASSALTEAFKAAGWGYGQRLARDNRTVVATRLTHPSHLAMDGTGWRAPLGLGLALLDFAEQFSSFDLAYEVAGSMQCSELAAVADVLGALGLSGSAANWQEAHESTEGEHTKACRARRVAAAQFAGSVR